MKVPYIEAGLLQPVCDEIQKVDELAKHDALRGCVLPSEIAQLLNQGLDLRRRAPLVEVQSAENTLTRLHFLLVNLNCRCFQVDGESEMTHGASRLRIRVSR